MAIELNFIGLVTRDLTASLAFYRALGIDVPETNDAPHVEVTLPNGVVLAWDTVETIQGFDPAYTPGTGGHRIALAFKQDSPAGVDAAFRRLEEAGFAGHVQPWDAHWGQRYATVLDPDGNSIDLYAELA